MRCLMQAALTLAIVAQAAAAQTSVPPGPRGDFIGTYRGVGQKVEALAAAFPQDKYDWAPGPGVRSACATFTHIAAENYDMGRAFGVAAAPANLAKVETLTCLGDKATVVAAVKKSFADILDAVGKMPDSDLEKPFTLFGASRPRRAWLLATAEHTGEHLGLLIAYARMNNIVPPWSK